MCESFGIIRFGVNSTRPNCAIFRSTAPRIADGLLILSRRSVWDTGNLARWDARFQKPFAVVGNVRGVFPAEIPQVPFDGHSGEAIQKNLGCLCSLLSLSHLRQRRGPHREHLEV